MSVPSLTVQADGGSPVTGDQLNTYQQTCNTIAELRGFIGVSGIQVYVRGTAAVNDGGQGVFYWNATGVHADDNGTTTAIPTGSASGSGEWTRISTGGTVNAGTAAQLAYYASTENSVSGLTTQASSVLVTDSNGNPSLSTTIPDGVTGSTQTVGDNSTKLATTAFVLANASAAISGYTGFRNRIINGDMRIDQRNSGASQTFTAAAVVAYTVDRFYASCTGANVTGQQIAGSGVDQYLYRFTGASSVTGILFGQRIEATNIYDLESSTVTLSVKLANSVLTTVTWAAYYPTVADNYAAKTQIATGTFTVTSSLTRYAVNISLPSNATNGVAIEFTVGAQTSGTWTIGEVQLESGSSATVFERLPIGVELALCQRYLPAFQGAGGTVGPARALTSTVAYAVFQYAATPRTPPTAISATGPTNFQIGGPSSNTALTALAFLTANYQTSVLQCTVASGLTGGQAVSLDAVGTCQILFTGCEL